MKRKLPILFVLIKLLSKTLLKTVFFQREFLKFISRSTIFPSFTISNLLLLRWRPFQYNIPFEKKCRIYSCFPYGFVKNLRKNYQFLVKISKIHVKIYCIANFHDFDICSTKMATVSYNSKFEINTFYTIVLIRLLSKTLWINSLFSIQIFEINFKIFCLPEIFMLQLAPTIIVVHSI